MANSEKRVLMLGMDCSLANELSEHFADRGFAVDQANSLPSGSAEADLIFVESGQPGLSALIRAVSPPVIVVSRLPEVADWLDAMDSGAADYVAAPFDTRQLDWILETNLGVSREREGAHASAA
jgi:DNA-binding response OmpR family regulator